MSSKEYNQKYYLKNKEKLNSDSQEYYKKNREKILVQKTQYWFSNKEKLQEKSKIQRQRDHIKILERNNKYDKLKRATDLSYRIRRAMKTRIYMALKHYKKAAGTVKLLGADLNIVKKHLESKFTNGMTWQNMGKWHIDHVKPCSAFDLSDPNQQKECFNYKNLQPLWARDNLKKSDYFVSEAPIGMENYLPNRYQ